VAAIPASIGIRFERRGSLPQARTVSDWRLMGVEPNVLAREVTLAGAQTTVRDVPTSEAPVWPIDVVHAPEATAAVDAAKAAVLGQRIRAPLSDRRVRLVIGAEAARGPAVADAAAMSQPWMADASARVARDTELQAAASQVAAGLGDARFSSEPWQTLASAADGRPLLAVAAWSASLSGERSSVPPTHLIVVSAASPTDIVTPLVMRSIANGIASAPDLQQAEVLPIADRQLQQWSRPASTPDAPGADALRQGDVEDDRRWFWLAALCLITIETWMRRARQATADERNQHEEDARVA
jgi:hypothetical protein